MAWECYTNRPAGRSTIPRRELIVDHALIDHPQSESNGSNGSHLAANGAPSHFGHSPSGLRTTSSALRSLRRAENRGDCSDSRAAWKALIDIQDSFRECCLCYHEGSPGTQGKPRGWLP